MELDRVTDGICDDLCASIRGFCGILMTNDPNMLAPIESTARHSPIDQVSKLERRVHQLGRCTVGTDLAAELATRAENYQVILCAAIR